MGLLSNIQTAGARAVDSALQGDVAGVADNLAGSVDETVGRQFDDTPGGGFTDPETVGSFVLDSPGARLLGAAAQDAAGGDPTRFVPDPTNIVPERVIRVPGMTGGGQDQNQNQDQSGGMVATLATGAGLLAVVGAAAWYLSEQ